MIKMISGVTLASILSASTASTPLVVALTLILTAAMLGILMYLTFTKWIGLAVLMIFIGGMMVMFIYVTSITANLKFTFKPSILWMGLLLILTFSVPTNSLSPPTLEPYMLYSPMSSIALVYLVFYLILTLVIVVKVVESFKGALTQKFF